MPIGVRDNRTKHELYKVYTAMKQRCYNKNCKVFNDYGFRGITVCDRWVEKDKGFFNFVEDLGIRPEGYTLERINNDLGYEPSNCRWATRTDQNLNKRTSKHNKLGLTGVTESTKCKNKYIVQLNYIHEVFMPSNGFSCEEIAGEVYEHLKSLLPNVAMIRYKCSLAHNRKTSTNVRGVTKRADGRFQVMITIDGVRTYLGCFKTLEDAKNAIAEAN